MIVVSNATPLIALAKIGRLSLLKDLFGSVVIPRSVYAEVAARYAQRPGAQEVRGSDWIKVQSVADQTNVDYLRADLDSGEAEVLVLAQELSADWVLLDEPKARLAAELLKLHFIGTIGLLLAAKRTGKIAAIRPLLDELRMKKFYLSQRVYQSALAEAGE